VEEVKKVEKLSSIPGRLPGQKFPVPEESDGTRIFYQSLFEENA
jgi:hypothetical protein